MTAAVTHTDRPHGQPILEARNVCRTFRVSAGMLRASRTLTAVDAVNLAVRPGEVVALVGEFGVR